MLIMSTQIIKLLLSETTSRHLKVIKVFPIIWKLQVRRDQDGFAES